MAASPRPSAALPVLAVVILLATACAADELDSTREDAGQAYVINIARRLK